MGAVQPDQERGGPEKMQRDVRDPEEARQSWNPVSRTLNRALTEKVQVSFEPDDPVRVLAGDGQGRVPLAAHDFVEPVEAEDRGDLHHASVGGAREAAEGGESVKGRHAHGLKLRPALTQVSAAGRTRAYGSPVSFRYGPPELGSR